MGRLAPTLVRPAGLGKGTRSPLYCLTPRWMPWPRFWIKHKALATSRGVVGHLIPGGGISHLQYADNTMIMVQGLDLDIINLKFLLLCFESMSGLTINFDKSEVMVLGYPEEERQRIAEGLNCKLADFPIT